VVGLCSPETTVLEICQKGDLFIEEALKLIYKNKTPKGIAFPTTISVNHIGCHHSPLLSDASGQATLTTGDLVKIQLGVHIDGYPAMAGHTLVVGAPSEGVQGRAADVTLAAHYALEAAIRTLRVGQTNVQVTNVVDQVTAAYGVKPMEGTFSFQVNQNTVNGEKSIILAPDSDKKREYTKSPCTFEAEEVYSIEVLTTTGKGKPLLSPHIRTSIYKKTGASYQLKLKSARAVFAEVSKIGEFPFTLRKLEDETKARAGMVECVRHRLVEPYDVMTEEEGELMAYFSSTVMVTPTGPLRLTAPPFDAQAYRSDKKIADEALLTLLASELRPKKEKKPKKAE